MFFYRLIGALFCSVCVYGFIWNRSDQRSKKTRQYHGVILFLQRLRSGILERRQFADILEECMVSVRMEIHLPLEQILKQMKETPAVEFAELWENFSTGLPIPKEDKRRIAMLKNILGSVDVDGQLRQIDSCIRMLEKHAEEEEEELRSQKKLYSKLGVLLSLLLIVILL